MQNLVQDHGLNRSSAFSLLDMCLIEYNTIPDNSPLVGHRLFVRGANVGPPVAKCWLKFHNSLSQSDWSL